MKKDVPREVFAQVFSVPAFVIPHAREFALNRPQLSGAALQAIHGRLVDYLERTQAHVRSGDRIQRAASRKVVQLIQATYNETFLEAL